MHNHVYENWLESIMAEPELGFKEVKTSKKVQAMFDELGISYTTGMH